MKGKKINWITLWLAVVSVLVFAGGTYAAYSSVRYMKSVAVAKAETAETADICFSSNYLLRRSENEPNAPVRLISVGGQTNTSVAITVCNYQQNAPEKPHKTDITYSLTAKLLDADGGELTLTEEQLAELKTKLTIQKTGGTSDGAWAGATFSASGLLSGGVQDWDVYTITCTEPELLNTVSIQMRVVPASCEYCPLGNYVLFSRLKMIATTNMAQAWAGHIMDTVVNAGDVIDAFNYELYGTAKGTVTLRWTEDVTPTIWSLEKILPPGADIEAALTNRMITVQVGGIGKPTSYRVQFYRTNGFLSNEDATRFFSFVFTAEEQAG